MRHNKFIDNVILRPMSIIYGMVVGLRNKLFDWGILKEKVYPIPVVVVGNLSVGGTGKTPHTEYIVEALKSEYRIGILSRGYKRSTKGFVLASRHSTPWDIGDEPYQMYQKFGQEVRVAVCEKRTKGIEELCRIDPTINLIVLDDAFQHRYVKPSASVVLMEWNRPVYNDDILPLGRLRESAHGLLRCDFVVITKCPREVRPMDVRLIYDHLGLYAYQKVFYSRYNYGNLVSVFPDECTYIPNLSWLTGDDNVLLVSGIANPRPLFRYLKAFKAEVKMKRFPDHHQFSRKDFDEVLKAFNGLPGKNKIIVTTEKDSVRIVNSPYYPHELKPYTFYLPIKVDFLPFKMPGMGGSFESELKNKLRNPSPIT